MIKTIINKMTSPPILEGLFAVNKPQSLTSADVLRKLQGTFNRSRLFEEYLTAERARLTAESAHQRGRRSKAKRGKAKVKMGHGGTLDPLATGVLVVGLGSGTKKLGTLLGGIKEYEATAILGCATDTYDRLGKITSRAEWKHVTKEMVEEKLGLFRGEILQLPPIYSALNMNGKRLYEYARAGEELPKELEPRKMKVDSLELISFEEGGTHGWSLPEEEADEAMKSLQGKVDEIVGEEVPEIKRAKTSTTTPTATTTKTSSPQSHSRAQSPSNLSIPPILKFRMTVSSGFYVRSFIHDLGLALGSAAHMVELVRTKQSSFALGTENTIEWEDFGIPVPVWHKERSEKGAQGARIGGEREEVEEGTEKKEAQGEGEGVEEKEEQKGRREKRNKKEKEEEEDGGEGEGEQDTQPKVWEEKLVKALENYAASTASSSAA